jgi:hypothetical protein
MILVTKLLWFAVQRFNALLAQFVYLNPGFAVKLQRTYTTKVQNVQAVKSLSSCILARVAAREEVGIERSAALEHWDVLNRVNLACRQRTGAG